LADPTSSKFYWRLLQIVLLIAVASLLLAPQVWVNKVGDAENIVISGYQVLFASTGLEPALQALALDPHGIMLISVVLLGLAFLFSFLPKKPFYPLVFIILSGAFAALALIHFEWFERTTRSRMLWGFWLYLGLSFFAIVLNIVGSGLERLKVRTGEFKSHMSLLMMLAPGVLFLIIFAYLPMPGILLSFKNLKLHGQSIFENFFKSAWVGMGNFRFIFATPDALTMTTNTVLYNLTFIALGLLASVGIAVGITEISNRRTAKVYQTMYFLPFFLSWVVVSYLTYALLQDRHGVINTLLRSWGRDPINWYASPQYWPFIFVIANLWKYAGNGSIIYMATIVGMDAALFEAASIDGAGRARQIWHITLPLLKPTAILLTILNIGRIFYADFGMFYLLKQGSGLLKNVSMVIDVYVYEALSKGTINIGMVAAVALYQSVVGFVLILLTNWIVSKISPDNTLL